VVLTAAKCRSCQAPVVFVKTEASGGTKVMPLDPEVSDDGNVVVMPDTGRARVFKDAAAIPAELAGRPRHFSHFATCPEGPAHRRSKR
jgi:hypothetical protein